VFPAALMMAATAGSALTVQALLSNGARVNLPDCQGRTALWYAAERGHEEVVEVLLNYGADPAASRSDSTSCLMVAAQRDRPNVLKQLLGRGGKPQQRGQPMLTLMEARDANGLNAMGLAAKEGNEAALRALLAECPKENVPQRAAEALAVARRYRKEPNCLKVRAIVCVLGGGWVRCLVAGGLSMRSRW
jgi:hypothetical protein